MCSPRKLDYARYFWFFFFCSSAFAVVCSWKSSRKLWCVCGRRSWQTIFFSRCFVLCQFFGSRKKCDSSRNWQKINEIRIHTKTHTHTHTHRMQTKSVRKINTRGWFGCTHFLKRNFICAHNVHMWLWCVHASMDVIAADWLLLYIYMSHFVNDVACQTEPSIAASIIVDPNAQNRTQTNDRHK